MSSLRVAGLARGMSCVLAGGMHRTSLSAGPEGQQWLIHRKCLSVYFSHFGNQLVTDLCELLNLLILRQDTGQYVYSVTAEIYAVEVSSSLSLQHDGDASYLLQQGLFQRLILHLLLPQAGGKRHAL